MQIVESTRWGVRTARLTFRSAGSGTSVTLFPMLHVGEPSFYERVYDDAFAHDAVLTEGVKSPVANSITRSYRWIDRSPAMRLVVQPRFPASRAKVLHADLSQDEFETLWRDVPLYLRLAIHLLSPCLGLHRRWFGSRETLAAGLTRDDLASQEELLSWTEETAFLNRVILDARDERLIERLFTTLDASDAPTSIAVVYGAAHMRAASRALVRRGYACTDAEWMTVFEL